MLASSATADGRGTDEVRDKKMRAPLALEKKTVLWDETVAYLVAQTSTDIKSHLRWRSLWKSANELSKDDAMSASILCAMLLSAAGDLEGAEYWLRNLEQLGDASRALSWRMCLLGNQGYASRALELAPTVLANPAPVPFAEVAIAASWFGAFTSIVQAVNNAIQQHKVLVKVTQQVEIARQADHVMSLLGVTESQYAAVLDVAGEMMRARRLAWSETSSFHIIDEAPEQLGILMIYRIHVSPEEASDMNFELASTLVDRDLDKPGLSVSFQGMKAH